MSPIVPIEDLAPHEQVSELLEISPEIQGELLVKVEV